MRALGRVAGGRDEVCAGALASATAGVADAAGAGMDQHALAGRDPVQRQHRGELGHGLAAPLRPVERPAGCGRASRASTITRLAKQPAAIATTTVSRARRRSRPRRPRPPAGAFDTGRTGIAGIEAQQVHHVAEIDARGRDLDHDFAGARPAARGGSPGERAAGGGPSRRRDEPPSGIGSSAGARAASSGADSLPSRSRAAGHGVDFGGRPAHAAVRGRAAADRSSGRSCASVPTRPTIAAARARRVPRPRAGRRRSGAAAASAHSIRLRPWPPEHQCRQAATGSVWLRRSRSAGRALGAGRHRPEPAEAPRSWIAAGPPARAIRAMPMPWQTSHGPARLVEQRHGEAVLLLRRATAGAACRRTRPADRRRPAARRRRYLPAAGRPGSARPRRAAWDRAARPDPARREAVDRRLVRSGGGSRGSKLWP